jgi:hypothetical protein
MKSIPCISDYGQSQDDRDTRRSDAIVERSEELYEEYWVDEERVSEALTDALYYFAKDSDRDEGNLDIIRKFMDGDCDEDFVGMLRMRVDMYFSEMAETFATEEVDGKSERDFLYGDD